ncbi:hypothetical protein E2C01_040034 [Portunus trituberculatus]|uniref:Uncharacterized protein n=1 Tax=Portunus trituberculatus TaxID=210409 RepID=A0A5B7FLW1_PORTR|nr:hypothetical protein [Portunus trituberculatus]
MAGGSAGGSSALPAGPVVATPAEHHVGRPATARGHHRQPGLGGDDLHTPGQGGHHHPGRGRGAGGGRGACVVVVVVVVVVVRAASPVPEAGRQVAGLRRAGVLHPAAQL